MNVPADKNGESNVSLKCRLAIVVSRFNDEITEKLLQNALKRLQEKDFSEKDFCVVKVPGAVEIPIAAQRLAQLGVYDAVICLGAVVRGDTDHYRYVCEQVSQGCQTVALQNDIPVVFGVLTTDTEAQANSRLDKGAEAVDTAIEMVSLLRKISKS